MWRKNVGLLLMTVFMVALSVSAMAEEIKTEKLKEYIQEQGAVVVDTRISDAFNGWRLEGVSRGGHIPGAVSFSSAWLSVENKDAEKLLSEALADKGITPDKTVVLYDANGSDAKKMETWLRGKGFEKVYTYDLKAWASDQALPMVKLPNYQIIVPAAVLKDIVDGKKPETFEGAKSIKVLEASWGKEKNSYAKGHVPGAVHVNTDWVEPPKEYEIAGEDKPVTMWLLAPDSELFSFAERLGITAEDTVVLTGAEQMAAYRVAFALRYLGVSDVRILNGGTGAWTRAGYSLSKESAKPSPVKSFGRTTPLRPDMLDTMAELKEKLANDSNFLLMDIRTWPEHIGEISGYSYHNRKGRIPGSIFAYAGRGDAYSLDYYRNLDRTMREPADVIAMWNGRGIDTSKHLSFMCGSGWRAAEVWFYANVMGLTDTSMYSDGWIGWSNAGYPIETGEPSK